MNIKIMLFLLLMVNAIQAQEFKLGKVTVEELLEKNHPTDTSAVAAILCKIGKTYFNYEEKKGFVAYHETHIRIKIYKKEGLDWANFEIPYFTGYEELSDDLVNFTDGITYNIESGNIEKTKINNEGKFKVNIDKNWKKATITMPNVKVGSIIEIKYVLKTENLLKFPKYDFQYKIPVKYSEYITEIPEYYIYKPILTGFVDVKNESKFMSKSQIFYNENGQSQSMEYKQIYAKYNAENIPAIMDEKFVDNLNNYKSSLSQELEKVRYPEQAVKDFSNTWEGVAKTIYSKENFGRELNERSYLVNDFKAIINDNQTLSEIEKLHLIFKFIQQKMNWNGEYGYSTDKGVKQAYQDKTGNSAEINFNLINMLRLSGINANPVLVSTLDYGIPVYPSRTGFNYVIVAADINGERFLLDANNKFTTPNILPMNVINWNGRLIRQDETSEEINLVPIKASKQIYNLTVLLTKDGNISGKYLVQKTNYEALSFRQNEAILKEESYIEKKENQLVGVEIKEYSIENKDDDLSNPVIEKFTFASSNHCEIIGGKLFINPLLFFTTNSNPFIQEKRTMPIYFGYPKQEKYNISYEIPEGYEVESVPKAMKISSVDGALVYSVNSSVNGKNIQIIIAIETNIAITSAENYNGLKDFYQKMIDKQHEKIVLKKI